MRLARPRRSGRLLIVALLVSSILAAVFLRPTDTAQAFVPNRPAEFVLGVGLNNRTHESITRTAITTIDKDMFHVAQITGSMDFAITEIANSNVSVDTPKQLGGTQFSASASHFDGENFAGSMRRLRDYKNNVISRMAARDVGQARYYLGQALHTLQDFYSHSNWIERGGTSPWAALGVSVLPNPSPNVQTCNNCARNNCTDCDALLPGAPLTTGYFDSDDRRKPNEFKCSHGGVNRLDADTSGAGSLHNGINKDTRDCRDSPHSNLHEAAARVATQATVDYVKSITNAIGPAKSKLLLGAGTTLAFAVDTTGSMDDEIEAIQDKLLEMVDVRMGTPLEPTLFVLSAFNDPGGPPNSANSANGTLLNTSDVNEFKNAVMALTADGGGDCPELPYFGMGDAMRYIRDCNLYVFTDAGARESVFDREVVTEEMVRGKVHPQIFFTGSSYFDCPIDEDYYVTAEKTGGTVYEISPEEIYDISALPGLLDLVNGVDLGYYRGYFNGFWQTYYIPVDTFLSRTTIIINGAPSANLIIHRPDGTQVAATDPNVTFIPYGTGTIFSFVNPAPGLWSVSVNGTPPAPLSAPLAARSSATREGEVTSTKGQAQSQGNAPRASKSTEPRASMATSGGGGPAAQLAGDPGAFTIQVKGESDMHSARFDFAEVGGVSGHVGMFPIQSSPLVGATQNVMASIAATGASNVQFEFRNTDGSLLQTLNMTEIPPLPADPDIDPVADVQRVFVGEVTVPSVPFQVFVTGVDTNGVTYQRMVPGLIRPQTLEVTPPAFEDMSPGQARTYKVKVRNAGPADTFRLGASDDLHYVSAPVPASITLATNETREVTLKLQVPVDAPLDDVDTVTVTANSETTPGVGNTVSRPPFRIVAPPVLKLDSLTATPSGGDGDAFIEPGEGGTIDARLLNVGADAAAGITATLSSSTPGVTVTSAESLYADLAPGDGASPATPFTFTVAPAASCGQTMEFTLRVDYDAGTAPIFHHFFIPTGHGSDEHVFSYAGAPVAIPDADPAGVGVPLTVSGLAGGIKKLTFSFDGSECSSAEGATTVGLDHPYVGDLTVTLTSPRGTSAILLKRPASQYDAGSNGGNNFCNTLFDDDSGGPKMDDVYGDIEPFSGTFTANELLAAFEGEDPNGTWTLRVTDTEQDDAGSLRAFSLHITDFACEDGPPPNNLPPTISLTGPTAGTTFTAPANITLNADAADSDGTVSKVEFYAGPTKLGEDTTAPFTFDWSNVAGGSYNLTAKATDNQGAKTTSALVSILVNAPPTVSVSAPAEGALMGAPADINITAAAADTDGTVSKVEFYAGSTKLGEDTTAPFAFVWNNVAAGAYALTARAFDNTGAFTTSAPVNVLVTAGGVVGRVTRQDGVTAIAGAVVTVSQGTNVLGTAGTNSQGDYSGLPLPSGSYSVTASAPGYTAQNQPNVVVTESAATVVNFSLSGLPPPTVTGFTPHVGAPGTPVTISGTNFDANAAADTVRFNVADTTGSSASATELSTAVPAGATSGHITVTTAAGSAVSVDDFFVPPSPYTAADVEFTGRMQTGTSPTVTLNTAGKIGLMVFDGTAGQRVSLKIDGVALTGGNGYLDVFIRKPDGTTLASATYINSGGDFIDTQTLPTTGTYTILFDPQGTNAGSASLTLDDVPADVTGELTVGGPPLTVTTSAAGQNAQVVFAGTAGQRVSLKLSGVSLTGGNGYFHALIRKPDGSTLSSLTYLSASGGFIDAVSLPVTGTYTVFIDPMGTNKVSVTLTLYDVPADTTQTITAGGASVTATTNTAGQRALVTFAGSAGQRISLKITNVSLTGGNGYLDVTIKKPDGTTLTWVNYVNSGGDYIDTQTLPTAGTYTIVVDPQGTNTGSATLTLYDVPPDVTGTMTVGGPALSVTTTVPGQNGLITFNGASGQRINLNISGVSMSGGNGRLDVTIRKPDGTTLASSTYVDASGAFINTQTLPSAGTYSISVNPQGSNVGSATLTLGDVSSDVTGTINADGTAVTLTTTSAGQNAQWTFGGTAGQRISLKVSGVSLTGGNGYLDVFIKKPDGTTLASATYISSSGDFIDTKTLPTSGTYTIVVDPQGSNVGSATLTLYNVPPDASAAVTPGGSPVTVTTTTPGQNGQVTFGGTTGQRVSLKVSGVSMTGGNGYLDVTIKKPDGTALASATYVSSSGDFIDTRALPSSGTYTIFFNPQTSNVGSGTLTLYDVPADSTGTITAGGASVTTTTTVPGQNAQLTFAGTSGQRISLRVTGVSLSGGNGYLDVTIKKPDGTTLASATYISASGDFIDTKTLPSTGTYTILVNPQGTNTGSATLTLYEVPVDVGGALTPGGGSLSLTMSTPGQNATPTFSGTAGQRVSLLISGVSMTGGNGYLDVFIKKPDGTTLASSTYISSSGGFIDTQTLPTTGTYTVLVNPQGTNTGSAALTLYEVPADATDSVTVNGSTVNVATTVPGQNASLTFSGGASQQVTVQVTNSQLAPVIVRLLKPDGTTLTSYTSYGGSSFNLSAQTLPTAGTYTIVIDPMTEKVGGITIKVTSPSVGWLRGVLDLWRGLAA